MFANVTSFRMLYRWALSGQPRTGPAVRPKTPPRPVAKIKSDGVNDVWCVDVVFDTTQHGTTVKFLTLLDEYSHFNLDIVASRRMGSREVVAALQAAVAEHGAPRHLDAGLSSAPEELS